MHDTSLARSVWGPCIPAVEAGTAETDGLWQPSQVTPAANIGPGMSGTPRPPVPA
jgi:hypothetical protein